VTIVIGIVLAMLVGMVSGRSGGGGAGQVLGGLVVTGGYIVATIGWWLMTQPDPLGFGEDQYGTSRKLIRVALVVGIAGQLLNLVVRPGAISFGLVITLLLVALILQVISVIGFFAQLTFLSKIAMRIPDQNLSNRANFLRWAFAISYGAVLVFTIFVTMLVVSAARSGTGSAGGIAALGCFILIAGIAAAVFFVMYIILLFGMAGRFQEAAQFARGTWAATPFAPRGPATA
jgi:hypothetical protein